MRSLEIKNKISKNRKGLAYKIGKIDQFDKNNNFIKRWEKLIDITDNKSKRANIGRVLNNKRKSADGFYWKLV
jgi:hypothetical protein